MSESERKRIKSAFPFFDDERISQILSDVESALRSGVLSSGPRIREFERNFAEYLHAKHAVAVNSGTANLEIVLRHFGVKKREVIVPTNTFVATPNSVVFAGGRPVFADMRDDTLCLDPSDVESRITPKTAGIIVVHIAGLVCPQIFELLKICEDHGLFLIEDSAHAHGAMIDGRMAGTLSDAGCFSFYPTKVMTCGEGGMIVTENEELADASRVMRDHGLSSERIMVMLGHNWRMSEISAIVGLHQLKRLDSFVRRRNEIARSYSSYLKDVEGISLFKTPSNIRHSFYKYPIRLAEDFDAEKVGGVLKDIYGIETGSIYYPPCHLHPYYMETFGTKKGDFPTAEKVLKRILCLPMHMALTNDDVKYVAETLIRTLKN